jgi:hypothetical protein
MLSCPSNESYGHADAYRCYVGLDDWTPVEGRLQHGWGLRYNLASDYLSRIGCKYFIWSKVSMAPGIVPDGIIDWSRICVVGAPILYIDSKAVDATPSFGTLAVPAHSIIDRKIPREKWEAYCRFVLGYDPMSSILIHQRDVDLGYDKIAIEMGLNVLTAGHVRSIDFLHNLIRIIKSHNSIITNCVQTVCFYALHFGKYVKVCGPDTKTSPLDFGLDVFDHDWIRANYPQLLEGTSDKELAGPELGQKRDKDYIKRVMFPHAGI